MEFLLKRSINIKIYRNFFTSAFNLSNLSNLRKKTGYPLASCKTALTKFNDDIDLVCNNNKKIDQLHLLLVK
jgi:hypothetical protein